MSQMKLILVADGREESLILFHQVLTRSGYDVVLAATPEEALAQARRHRPDLILADPDLADGGGAELARRLREDPEGSGAPIVAISETGGPDRALREAGFCGAVARRIPLRALLDAIRRCLDGTAPAWGRPGVAPSVA